MSDTTLPSSKQLHLAVVGNTVITYASWDTGYGPSYGVGLRQGDDFRLLQSERFMRHNSETWMRALKAMLIGGLTPQEIQGLL